MYKQAYNFFLQYANRNCFLNKKYYIYYKIFYFILFTILFFYIILNNFSFFNDLSADRPYNKYRISSKRKNIYVYNFMHYSWIYFINYIN